VHVHGRELLVLELELLVLQGLLVPLKTVDPFVASSSAAFATCSNKLAASATDLPMSSTSVVESVPGGAVVVG
jgi:hypothetical protein